MNTHKKTFSIKAAIKTGWHLFWERPWLYLGLMGLSVVVSLLQQGTSLLPGDIGLVGVVLLTIWGLAVFAVSILVGLGSMKVILKSVRGEHPHFDEVWSVAPLFWRYILLTLVIALPIIGIGLLVALFMSLTEFTMGAAGLSIGFGIVIGLFALAAMIILFCLMFYPYVFLDHPTSSVREQLAYAWNITKGARWKLVAFGLVIAGVNLLGMLALVLGLLVTLPLTSIATASVYSVLAKQTPHPKLHD